jgi:hypothetical protein
MTGASASASGRSVVVFHPEDADVQVELEELGEQVREQAVEPGTPPPNPSSGRPIWDDPNVLQFISGLELREIGADALLEKVDPDTDVVGVVLQQPQLRYEDAQPLLDAAASRGVQVAFAVGFPMSDSASV